MSRSRHLTIKNEPSTPAASTLTRSNPTKAQRIILDDFARYLASARDQRNRPLGPKTQSAYVRTVLRLMQAAGSVEPTALVSHFSKSITPTTSYGTANPVQCALQRYEKWSSAERSTPAVNPTLYPYIGSLPRGRRGSLTHEELARFYDAVEAMPAQLSTIKTLLFLLPRTGLRIGEITTLTCANVDRRALKINGKRVTRYGFTVVGKGNKSRWIPLTPDAGERLRRYLDVLIDRELARDIAKGQSKSAQRLFPTSAATVERCLRTLREKHWTTEADGELCRISPHMLRHVYASHALERGVALNVVSKALGHSSINVTADVYGHVSDDVLAEAQE